MCNNQCINKLINIKSPQKLYKSQQLKVLTFGGWGAIALGWKWKGGEESWGLWTTAINWGGVQFNDCGDEGSFEPVSPATHRDEPLTAAASLSCDDVMERVVTILQDRAKLSLHAPLNHSPHGIQAPANAASVRRRIIESDRWDRHIHLNSPFACALSVLPVNGEEMWQVNKWDAFWSFY